MPTINLKKVSIQKREDKNFNPYFLIINLENEDETYTCFEWKMKEDWKELMNNWENIKEVELEYVEKEYNDKIYRNVVGCYFPKEGEIII